MRFGAESGAMHGDLPEEGKEGKLPASIKRWLTTNPQVRGYCLGHKGARVRVTADGSGRAAAGGRAIMKCNCTDQACISGRKAEGKREQECSRVMHGARLEKEGKESCLHQSKRWLTTNHPRTHGSESARDGRWGLAAAVAAVTCGRS